MYILIIIVILLLLYLTIPCNYFNRALSGRYYTSRNKETAEIIDKLRDISFMLADELVSPKKEKLKRRLRATTFKELVEDDRTILAWNYDKGREIAIRVYDINGNPFSARFIISSLFHELAHSLDNFSGHGYTFNVINDSLQLKVDKYVDILKNNTFLQ